jgi:hypothetical protein
VLSSCPDSGRFEWLKDRTPQEYAMRVKAAMRLTRTERKILSLIRSGSYLNCDARRKMVTLCDESKYPHRWQWFRRATLDRLSLIGLVKEQPGNNSGTDVTYVAVQPCSVN